MVSLADLTRTWLLRQLGLSSSVLTQADLEAAVYGSDATPRLANRDENYTVGSFYPTPGTTGTVQPGDDILFLTKKFIGVGCNIDQIACEVTTIGSAGCLVRGGVYKLSDDGTELELVVDGGTQLADALGVKVFPAVATLEPNTSYFFGVVTQGAPAVDPVYRASGVTTDGIGSTSATVVLSNTMGGYRIPGVNGALPATIEVPAASTMGNSLRMAFRVAA